MTKQRKQELKRVSNIRDAAQYTEYSKGGTLLTIFFLLILHSNFR